MADPLVDPARAAHRPRHQSAGHRGRGCLGKMPSGRVTWQVSGREGCPRQGPTPARVRIGGFALLPSPHLWPLLSKGSKGANKEGGGSANSRGGSTPPALGDLFAGGFPVLRPAGQRDAAGKEESSLVLLRPSSPSPVGPPGPPFTCQEVACLQ